jgi:hypothetical protein
LFLYFFHLYDYRNVRVDEEDEPYRKSSTATIRSEGTGTVYYNKVPVLLVLGLRYLC